MLNSSNCVVKLGVEVLTILGLIRVEIEKKVKIVTSVRAKTHILNAFVKVKLSGFSKNLSN